MKIELTKEYMEGWQAWFEVKPDSPYGEGIDTTACPYESGQMNDRRVRFLAGWWAGYISDWLEQFEARWAQRRMAHG